MHSSWRSQDDGRTSPQQLTSVLPLRLHPHTRVWRLHTSGGPLLSLQLCKLPGQQEPANEITYAFPAHHRWQVPSSLSSSMECVALAQLALWASTERCKSQRQDNKCEMPLLRLLSDKSCSSAASDLSVKCGVHECMVVSAVAKSTRARQSTSWGHRLKLASWVVCGIC